MREEERKRERERDRESIKLRGNTECVYQHFQRNIDCQLIEVITWNNYLY